VAAILELLTVRLPGTAGLDGLILDFAWIPVFSSTDHTTALAGGSR